MKIDNCQRCQEHEKQFQEKEAAFSLLLESYNLLKEKSSLIDLLEVSLQEARSDSQLLRCQLEALSQQNSLIQATAQPQRIEKENLEKDHQILDLFKEVAFLKDKIKRLQNYSLHLENQNLAKFDDSGTKTKKVLQTLHLKNQLAAKKEIIRNCDKKLRITADIAELERKKRKETEQKLADLEKELCSTKPPYLKPTDEPSSYSRFVKSRFCMRRAASDCYHSVFDGKAPFLASEDTPTLEKYENQGRGLS